MSGATVGCFTVMKREETVGPSSCDQSSEVISRCELIGIRLPFDSQEGVRFVQEQPERS